MKIALLAVESCLTILGTTSTPSTPSTFFTFTSNLYSYSLRKLTYRIYVYKSQLRDKISRRNPKPEMDTLKRSATGGTAVRY